MMSSPTSPQNTVAANTLSLLPPIVTDSMKRSSTSAKDRLSTFSNVSYASQNRSRPGSHVFPIFHSSLTYALVRDFAYPSIHPLHYGPSPPRASGVSTPASEQRPLSDPPTSWDTSRSQAWGSESGSYGHHQHLPAMSFGDGPPYSEDEDLHSPVVTSHRKKSVDENGMPDDYEGTGEVPAHDDRGTFVGYNADGSEIYYVNGGVAMEDGPGGQYVTYPASEGRHPYAGYGGPGAQQGYGQDPSFDSEDEQMGADRYSHDYQFAVGCPDEEMHGKAVALFDFVREHENELPLTEGQVIYVSYRHGQGWLVAQDPKTGENGLVPEEFVRLLRDIEGGLTSLNGESNLDAMETGEYLAPDSSDSGGQATPTQDKQLSLATDDTHSAEAGDHGTNEDTPATASPADAENNTAASHATPEAGNPSDKAAGTAGSRSNMLAKT